VTGVEWALTCIAITAAAAAAVYRDTATRVRAANVALRDTNRRLASELAEIEAICSEAVTRVSDPMYQAVQREVAEDTAQRWGDIVANFTVADPRRPTDDREGS